MEQQRSQIESDQNGFFDSLRQQLADAAGKISQLQGDNLRLLAAIGEDAIEKRDLTQENKALKEKARAESAGHKAILEVLDNVRRMMSHLEGEYAGTWVHTGAERVYKSFCDALRRLGIERILCSVGDAFDPVVHEAVAKEPGKRNAVTRVMRDGYHYTDGGIIQHVSVAVGDGSVE